MLVKFRTSGGFSCLRRSKREYTIEITVNSECALSPALPLAIEFQIKDGCGWLRVLGKSTIRMVYKDHDRAKSAYEFLK